MRDRSALISKLSESGASRAAYIRAKVGVLISSQLRALRLRRFGTQERFAHEANMKQSRVSAMECPGAVNFNLETLVRAAATFRVGLKVEFVPFSQMLRWENSFSQDNFDVVKIEEDVAYLNPGQQALMPSTPVPPTPPKWLDALRDQSLGSTEYDPRRGLSVGLPQPSIQIPGAGDERALPIPVSASVAGIGTSDKLQLSGSGQ